MEYREFGSRTGWHVSAVSFGSWAIGGAWGESKDAESRAALNAALDAGVNLIDTADVYGDGRSERLIAEVIAERRREGKKVGAGPDDRVYVVTKAGRAPDPHGPDNYLMENLRARITASRERLGVEKLDLIQLHCPPTSVLEDGKVFDVLRTLRDEGLFAHWGVSVETVHEAEVAMAQEDCASLQIIYNMFRLKPGQEGGVLEQAKGKGVGVLARVPLASGLLTGRITEDTVFAKDDHRSFNADGSCFDAGETLSGLGLVLKEAAFPAIAQLQRILESYKERVGGGGGAGGGGGGGGEGGGVGDVTLAQFALRWVLQNPAVVVIPGCRTVAHVASNTAAAALPPLSEEEMASVNSVYEEHIKEHVHHKW